MTTTTVVTSYEIPLEPASQTFQIALAGIVYSVTLWWSTIGNCWNMSFADANQVPIIDSIPLVTGVDLLGPFEYLDFGGQLVVQTDHDSGAIPTYTNLGKTSHVYFVVTSTVVSAAVTNFTNIYFGLPDTSGLTGGGDGRDVHIPTRPPRSESA